MSRRIEQTRWRPPVSSWIVAGLVCWVAGLAEPGAVVVQAQQPADPFRLEPGVADVEDSARELDRVRSLVLPQQKEWARKIIKTDPGSDVAKLAQNLLDEYTRYDELAEQEKQRQQAWSRYVKAYWDARRCPAPISHAVPLTITNATQQPVLYQMQGYSMDWSGPYRLRPGETHSFHYPIQYRSVTRTGMTVHSLSVGRKYEFRSSNADGESCLIEVRD